MKSPTRPEKNVSAQKTITQKVKSTLYFIWLNRKLAAEKNKLKSAIFTPETSFLTKPTNRTQNFQSRYIQLADRYTQRRLSNRQFLATYMKTYHSRNENQLFTQRGLIGLPPIQNIFSPLQKPKSMLEKYKTNAPILHKNGSSHGKIRARKVKGATESLGGFKLILKSCFCN